MAKIKFQVEKHSLIPKHSKLSDKAKEELLKQYKITLKDLPRIFKSDAAIQSLDLRQGDIIKITRKSMTAGESIFYRVVIDV